MHDIIERSVLLGMMRTDNKVGYVSCDWNKGRGVCFGKLFGQAHLAAFSPSPRTSAARWSTCPEWRPLRAQGWPSQPPAFPAPFPLASPPKTAKGNLADVGLKPHAVGFTAARRVEGHIETHYSLTITVTWHYNLNLVCLLFLFHFAFCHNNQHTTRLTRFTVRED